MPQITKKRSSEEIHSKPTPVSRDGSQTLSYNSEKAKTEKSRKSSTKRDSIAELSEKQQQKSSELKNLKPKNIALGKVSSDTAIQKEKSSNILEQNGERFNSEKLYTSKSVPPTDVKYHRNKEALRKSPKQSETPTRQGSIPPIQNQNPSKTSSPDQLLGTSPSSTPHTTASKASPKMNAGTSVMK